MKKKFSIIILLSIMALLILDNKTVLLGASSGIRMCIDTVIPVLFPFLIITTLLTSAVSNMKLSILSRIGSIMHLPAGSEILWLIGLLGGYPAGAQCISLAVDHGNFAASDGKRLLGICNNAGPAFIFGLGMHILSDLRLCLLVWLIHILSSVIVGILVPGVSHSDDLNFRNTQISVALAVKKAVSSISVICGWVLLFQILMELLKKWILWIFPLEAQIFLCGFLELTNGCVKLQTLPSMAMRFVFFSTFLSFGGLCVTMQTFAVSNVSNRLYLPEKLLQTLISALVSSVFSFFLFQDLPSDTMLITTMCAISIVPVVILIKKKFKKSVEFNQRILYNDVKIHMR